MEAVQATHENGQKMEIEDGHSVSNATKDLTSKTNPNAATLESTLSDANDQSPLVVQAFHTPSANVSNSRLPSGGASPDQSKLSAPSGISPVVNSKYSPTPNKGEKRNSNLKSPSPAVNGTQALPNSEGQTQGQLVAAQPQVSLPQLSPNPAQKPLQDGQNTRKAAGGVVGGGVPPTPGGGAAQVPAAGGNTGGHPADQGHNPRGAGGADGAGGGGMGGGAGGGGHQMDIVEEEGWQGEGTLRWHMKNVKERIKSSENIVSDLFITLRNVPWRLLVNNRPYNNNTGRSVAYLGVYVQCNGDCQTTGWTCHGQAEVRLLPQKPCTLSSIQAPTLPKPRLNEQGENQQTEGTMLLSDGSVRRLVSHMFNQKENDWGFNQFMPINELINVANPWYKDDSLLFEVKIQCDPPHGLSWDSKKVTGFVGLRNQGATCYMNSLLQTLFFTNKLRKGVYLLPTENDDSEKSVPFALQRVFYELQTLDKAPSTKRLTKSFGWDSLESFMQHDVQELSRVLLDNLENKMKGTDVEGTIARLFEGRMESYVRCKHVNISSSRIENFYDIQLSIKGRGSLEESFTVYITPDILDGDNKYDAGSHGMQAAEKGVIFLNFPPVLHLQLMRFQFDPVTETNVKVNDRFEFPEHLNLDKFLKSPDPQHPANYFLHAVLVHSGDNHGGHYVVYINPRGDGKWYRFDDEVVCSSSAEEAIRHNFGGSKETEDWKLNSSAYMLVYIQETSKQDVLLPVSDDDLPDLLIKKIEEERRVDALKKQERTETAQFIPITCLVGNEIFEQHLQGNNMQELFEVERLTHIQQYQQPAILPSVVQERLPSFVRSIRVRKEATLAQFHEQLAKLSGYPPNCIRFWNLYQYESQYGGQVYRPLPLGWNLVLSNRVTSPPIEQMKMEELVTEPFCGWIELCEEPLPPYNRETDHLVFLKRFDGSTAFGPLLQYCGHCLVQPASTTLEDFLRLFCQRARFPPPSECYQNLALYEQFRVCNEQVCTEHFESIEVNATSLQQPISNLIRRMPQLGTWQNQRGFGIAALKRLMADFQQNSREGSLFLKAMSMHLTYVSRILVLQLKRDPLDLYIKPLVLAPSPSSSTPSTTAPASSSSSEPSDRSSQLFISIKDYCAELRDHNEFLVADRSLPSDNGFAIDLSTKLVWGDVVTLIARALRVDPNRMLLFFTRPNTPTANSAIVNKDAIRVGLNMPFSKIIDHYCQGSQKKSKDQYFGRRIYYLILNMQLAELETKAQFKCIYVNSLKLREEKELVITIEKNLTVRDLLIEARKQLSSSDLALSPNSPTPGVQFSESGPNLSFVPHEGMPVEQQAHSPPLPNSPTSLLPLRLMMVHCCKILAIFQDDLSLDVVYAQCGERSVVAGYVTALTGKQLRIEVVPAEEMQEAMQEDEVIFSVSHYDKDLSSTFGIPFTIKSKHAESLDMTAEHIKRRLLLAEVPEKDLEKYQFALIESTTANHMPACTYSQPLLGAEVLKSTTFQLKHWFETIKCRCSKGASSQTGTLTRSPNCPVHRQGALQPQSVMPSNPSPGPCIWIGLDHPNTGSARRVRNVLEKSIKIHN